MFLSSGAIGQQAAAAAPGAASGDLIVAVVGAGTTPTLSITGCTAFDQQDRFGNAASRALHRVADGIGGGDVTITPSAAEAAASAIFRISGAATVGAQSASGTDPDPPGIAPPAGAGDNRVIAAAVGDGSDGFTGAPAGRSNHVGWDGPSTDAVPMGTADKEVTGSSEDPGTFTMGGSEQRSARTIAVR